MAQFIKTKHNGIFNILKPGPGHVNGDGFKPVEKVDLTKSASELIRSGLNRGEIPLKAVKQLDL